MADVSISYKDATIAQMSASGTKTLLTADNYCENNIVVEYTRPTASDLVSGTLSITENGTGIDVTNYANVDVNVSGGGGGGGDDSASSKQIHFIDYDGTIVESYTKSEWQNVTALPSNPSHSGLTAQGWNWTKAQIDEQLTAMPDNDVWVGQMYITDDGKTRVYIRLEKGRLHPYFGICPNGTVIVDWGDNSATATLTGTSLTTVKIADHEYTSAGEYVITLTASSGNFVFFGTSNTSYILRKNNTKTANIHRVYTNAVQKIELGTGVGIGEYAFANCFSLASITIPSGVTSIGNYAFTNCDSLTDITIPNGITNIGTYVFYCCYALANITIPSGVTDIGAKAFYYCYSLASITIPSVVAYIRTGAFQNCTSLTNITIPSGVTSIEVNTFQNCFSLASITIPSGVTSIGNYAFQNCYSLANIVIPSGVTNIGTYAFSCCYALTNITIPSGVASIGAYAFQNCYSLASITIPSGVTSIGTTAFFGCYALANITIPSEVTSIEAYAFQNCTSLANITIPSGVTSIETNTFYGCCSLVNITIPSEVTSIKKSAFQSCYGMAEYHFLPIIPPTLEATSAFSSIQSDCIIYVPSESLEAYQTATNWSTYASYMRGE